MTEQEKLELQLEQDARLLVDAIQRISTSTAAYELKFGPAVADTRTDKITWTAKHVQHFVKNDGQASPGDHWQNLLAGMYVV